MSKTLGKPLGKALNESLVVQVDLPANNSKSLTTHLDWQLRLTCMISEIAWCDWRMISSS